MSASKTSKALILPLVVNDLVIKEESCNLSCEYCLTGQSLFQQDHHLQMIFNPPRPNSCLPGTELHARLETMLVAVSTQDVPVIKISGGEVLLVRGIMAFIERLSAMYETVVILTNGLLMTDDKLDQLAAMGNIVLQISLDATRYAGNSYRVRSQEVHDRLMERIYRILKRGLPSEIYTVLNNRSILELEQTYTDLLPYADHTMVFPFPVRGPSREQFLPRPDQYGNLRGVIEQAERYGNLMPSYPYLERLWRFFTEGGRTFRCHLPRIAFTTFDDGTTTSCPNIWFNHVGNLVTEQPEKVFGQMRDSKFRSLLLAERPRIDACKACYTPWDPVSLYFEGQLTLDELARVPIYRGPRTRDRLAALQAAYLVESSSCAQCNYPNT